MVPNYGRCSLKSEISKKAKCYTTGIKKVKPLQQWKAATKKKLRTNHFHRSLGLERVLKALVLLIRIKNLTWEESQRTCQEHFQAGSKRRTQQLSRSDTDERLLSKRTKQSRRLKYLGLASR